MSAKVINKKYKIQNKKYEILHCRLTQISTTADRELDRIINFCKNKNSLTNTLNSEVKMSDVLELSDLLEKDEVEMIYRRVLSEKEWEVIRFNLKSKFWSKVRKEMLAALEDSPDFYLEDK
jgi:hypothetical protein